MSDQFTVGARASATDNSMEWYDKATGSAVFNIAQTGNVQYKKLTLTAAQVKALHATPITLIADPGTGKFIQILDAVLHLNFGTQAFAAGSTVQILANSIAAATTTAALINASASSWIQPAFPAIGTTASLGAGNSAVTITAATSEFTTGDSTVDVHLWYALVS